MFSLVISQLFVSLIELGIAVWLWSKTKTLKNRLAFIAARIVAVLIGILGVYALVTVIMIIF